MLGVTSVTEQTCPGRVPVRPDPVSCLRRTAKPHYCHCRMCQLGVGAPLTAWVNISREGFAFTGDEPTYYRSSSDLQPRLLPDLRRFDLHDRRGGTTMSA